MQLVGSDLFSLAGEQHVILADAFSGMIFVKHLNRETSTAVIKALMSSFRIIGFPQNLLSDGGPCYASDEFTEFCSTYHIRLLQLRHPHRKRQRLRERKGGGQDEYNLAGNKVSDTHNPLADNNISDTRNSPHKQIFGGRCGRRRRLCPKQTLHEKADRGEI